jgi:hypothetical protein
MKKKWRKRKRPEETKTVVMHGQEVKVKVYAPGRANAPPLYVLKGGERITGILGGGNGFLRQVEEDYRRR